MLYYICSVVHTVLLFFCTLRCARLRGLKFREHTFFALVPEQMRIFQVVVTRVEGKPHPGFNLNHVFFPFKISPFHSVQETTKKGDKRTFRALVSVPRAPVHHHVRSTYVGDNYLFFYVLKHTDAISLFPAVYICGFLYWDFGSNGRRTNL